MDFTGRVMRGFVFVQPAAVCDEVRLGSWLDLALDYNPYGKTIIRGEVTPELMSKAKASSVNIL